MHKRRLSLEREMLLSINGWAAFPGWVLCWELSWIRFVSVSVCIKSGPNTVSPEPLKLPSYHTHPSTSTYSRLPLVGRLTIALPQSSKRNYFSIFLQPQSPDCQPASQQASCPRARCGAWFLGHLWVSSLLGRVSWKLSLGWGLAWRRWPGGSHLWRREAGLGEGSSWLWGGSNGGLSESPSELWSWGRLPPGAWHWPTVSWELLAAGVTLGKVTLFGQGRLGKALWRTIESQAPGHWGWSVQPDRVPTAAPALQSLSVMETEPTCIQDPSPRL